MPKHNNRHGNGHQPHNHANASSKQQSSQHHSNVAVTSTGDDDVNNKVGIELSAIVVVDGSNASNNVEGAIKSPSVPLAPSATPVGIANSDNDVIVVIDDATGDEVLARSTHTGSPPAPAHVSMSTVHTSTSATTAPTSAPHPILDHPLLLRAVSLIRPPRIVHVPGVHTDVSGAVNEIVRRAGIRSGAVFALMIYSYILDVILSIAFLAVGWHESCSTLRTFILVQAIFKITASTCTTLIANQENQLSWYYKGQHHIFNIYEVVWMIVGQVSMFNSSCRTSSPWLYGFSFALVAKFYLTFFVFPALAYCMQEFLPCAYCFTNIFTRDEVKDVDWDFGVKCCGDECCALAPEPPRKAQVNVYPYTPDLGVGQKCDLCIEAYMIDDPIRSLACQHHYHKTCIDARLRRSLPSCPTCNANVELSNQNPTVAREYKA